MTAAEAVTQEVRALERLDLEALRSAWRRRYGPPPTLRSVALLRRMLAWRIQVAALGGLDAETRRKLRRDAPLKPLAPTPSAGTRLTREWKGVAHTVEVAADGFIHEAQRYASLSQVARAITGARWNGPRFFGLRAEGQVG